MTFGSLFAGFGGFDLGFERAGLQCRWQVEIDPFCRAVLEKHWPGVQRYEDVRHVGAHNLERVDVICGGFPCQDVSFAGPGAGLDGARSGLWFEYVRIVREIRPEYVVVENVTALLGRGLGRVLGDLAESGYDAEWDCIPASALGANHQRDRVWIVAYAACVGSDSRRPGSGWQARNIASRGSEAMADAGSQGLPSAESTPVFSAGRWQEGRAIAERGWWSVEPQVGRVAHGIPRRVDRLRGLGNAAVPQVTEWIGRGLIAAEQNNAS